MIDPTAAGESPSVSRPTIMYSARKKPPNRYMTASASSTGPTSGCARLARKPTRMSPTSVAPALEGAAPPSVDRIRLRSSADQR
jgi:hypothetical protein